MRKSGNKCFVLRPWCQAKFLKWLAPGYVCCTSRLYLWVLPELSLRRIIAVLLVLMFFLCRMFDQPVVSRLAATHLATHERETYYYKVGVTSSCQSQSAGLAFLNSCGCQLLAISAPTAGAFLSLTIRAVIGGGGVALIHPSLILLSNRRQFK